MLTTPDIKLVRGRFEEVREEYADLAIAVQAILVDYLAGAAVKHMVAYRAKSPASLERKLSSEECRNKYSPSDFHADLSPPLKDLAATRVLLYEADQVAGAVTGICQRLDELGHKVVEKKHYEKTNGYRGDHLYIRIQGQSRLCEVQVCTIGAHLWNELEHDIVYKQPGGLPDSGQEELLTSLHQELVLAETTVSRLMKRTADQVAKKGEPLLGPEDLRRYLEHREQRIVQGDHHDLFKILDYFLVDLTPAVLDNMIEASMSKEKAQELCEELDPVGGLKDVGVAAVRLVSQLDGPQVVEFVEGSGTPPPVWRFARKVLERIGEV